MPTVAFTDWLADVVTSRIVLCELQPAEQLVDWTVVGGFPNTYSRTFPQFVQTSVVPGGVYRRLDSVRQNATALTSRASIALVNANLGSYFFDTATNTLYISTTTGSDPDTFAFIGAYFTFFFATQPVDFVGGNLYEPRLTGVVPEVQSEVEDPLFGVKVFPSGDVDLINADRFFDQLVRGYIWKNKVATFWFGGGTLPFADYEKVATMRIEDVAPGDGVCRFKLRAMASLLESILPLNTLGTTEYPNLGEGLEGSYKPLLWGEVTDILGLLIDSTAGAQVYLIADASAQVLFQIAAVRAVHRTTRAVTTLVLTTHYTQNLTACTITVTSATYNATDYEIRIDAKGESDDAGSYLSTFGEIAKDLLLVLGETAANIDSAAFATADDEALAPLGLWARDPMPAAEHLRLLERSVLASVFVANSGQWTALVWDPTYNAATLMMLEDADFASWEPDDKIENIFWEARVKYAFNPATGTWKLTTASEAAIQYAYDTKDTVTIETALRNAQDASRLADRYRLMAGTPSVEIDATSRGLQPMTLKPFDKVSVTRSRAPSESGAYNGRIMEVLRIHKAFGPPSVTLRLGDLRGFGARVGRWASATAPDYGVATPSERERDGYWADVNGLVDPADMTTKDISIWY